MAVQKVEQKAKDREAMGLRPEPTTFTFKSKFREDKLTLKKQIIEALADGSKRVTGTEFIEFSQNTFSTQDPEVARVLREKIADRDKLGVPLHVIETTEGVEHGSIQP